MIDLYLVVQDHPERLPWAEEMIEGLPGTGYVCIYSDDMDNPGFNEQTDIRWETLNDLVALYYRQQGKPCGIEIQPYHALLEKVVDGVDGLKHRILSAEDYLNCYGLEYSSAFLYRCLPKLVCVAASESEAHQFIREQGAGLQSPRIVPVMSGVALQPEAAPALWTKTQ